MVTTGIAGVGLVNAEAAQASGCTIPPCGAVNNLSDRSVQVRWSNNNNGWTYAWVDPGRTIGGYFNDKRDVDYWNVPSGCTGYWTGQGDDWQHKVGAGWQKLRSDQTVDVVAITC
ncbi:MAG: hypothetical protein QG622_2761 [Actinomycetota bacterium]|nr:hypothetical protein [Actinomycetota bacterium]